LERQRRCSSVGRTVNKRNEASVNLMHEAFAIAATLGLASAAQAASDPLPSWNDGTAKQSILS
jgi:hypothetical protein